MTDNALARIGDWAPCYCCGRSHLAANMVRFMHHPDDALCVACVAWLYDVSRPIVRKLYPLWQLPVRIRAWRAPSPAPMTTNGRPPAPTPLCPQTEPTEATYEASRR
jgi:hypothetical protein